MPRKKVETISQFIFGFDIDGVLTNDDDGISSIWLEEASKYFGEPILKHAYYIEDAFNKTRAEVQRFFDARIDSIFNNVPAREHAAETLRGLANQGCIVHLITARDEQHREITENWLRKHNMPYHSLTMSPTNKSYSKGERCQELGVEFFVDDKVENAEDVASKGIYTVLYHASHNVGRQTSLPLVKSWLEVQKHIDFFCGQRLRQVP